jgi:hypothetical protein
MMPGTESKRYSRAVAAARPKRQQGGTGEPVQSGTISQRRIQRAAVVLGAALVLVAATLVGAVSVRRPTMPPVPLVTVRMAGSSLFFNDKIVQGELRKQGVALQDTSLGSRQIVDQFGLCRDYDVANTGSYDAGKNVEQRLRQDGCNAQDSSPFSSPMVVITYQPIVGLLEAINVVKRVGNLLIFDVKAYLSVVDANERWSDIQGNHSYPSHNRILLRTTDPEYSNSGGMFAAIASSAQLDDDPVANVQPSDPYLAVVRKCFAEQGALPTHTLDLLRQFLTDGMGRSPMAMVYEKDYINTKLDGPDSVPQGVVLMYPSPTVVTDETMVWWSDAGRRLVDLLDTDPVLIGLEERAGYRTVHANARFMRDMAAKGISVTDLDSPPPELQVVPLPTDSDLQALILSVGSHG